MTYTRLIPIEFNHCDPAGIVFYPRYFEMINSVIENFFADVLDASFADIHMQGGHGVPTVRIEANFKRPSRLGEKVMFSLNIKLIGRTSVTVLITAGDTQSPRLTADMTLVWMNLHAGAEQWPDGIRSRMTAFMETPT
ncbi:MAG: acyl-CoA thioesterase [Paracoccaceae bacterium]